MAKPTHRSKKPLKRLNTMSSFTMRALGDAFKPIQPNEKRDPLLLDPDQLQVWMIGHATLFINFYGTTILTDPVFVNWLPIPKRHIKVGHKPVDLPDIDIVAISHAHWDHFNKRSLKKVAHKSEHLILADNCSDLVKKMKFKNVMEMKWNTKQQIGDMVVHAYKPKHWGRRMPWEKIDRGYNSYVFEKNGKTIFFCGDSAYCKMFEKVGGKHDIDLAILPIGAYNPPNFRKVHMDPHDAINAFHDLKATYMIPMHWGNFRLSKEPMWEPVEMLVELAEEQDLQGLHVLQNGEMRDLTS